MGAQIFEKGIIGKKLGMTQVFAENGNVLPVTVILAGPCPVIQKKTKELDGYESVQLGFEEIPERKANSPKRGHFRKSGSAPVRHLKEFKLAGSANLNPGDVIKAETFTEGEKVDVTGMTKGRGYTGVVKRWGIAKKRMSHGAGPIHRHIGSLGTINPARLMKNLKMAGQYGNERVTVQNLEIVKVDAAKGLIAVKGAVPGARNGIVFVRSTVK